MRYFVCSFPWKEGNSHLDATTIPWHWIVPIEMGVNFNSRVGFEKDELLAVSNRGASVHNWYEVSQQGRIRWLIIICLFSSLLNWYIVPGVITAWLLTSQISGMKHDTLIYNWLYGMSWFMKIDLYGEDEEILIFFFFWQAYTRRSWVMNWVSSISWCL